MDYKWKIHKWMNDNDRLQNEYSSSMSIESQNTTSNEDIDNLFTRNSLTRSLSQNPQMNINRRTINRRKKKRIFRRTKSLNDILGFISGFWNWQLETGTWKEIGLVKPKKKKRKKKGEKYTSRQRNMIVCTSKTNENLERFTLNFFEASSVTTKNTSGKKIIRNIRSIIIHNATH